MIKTNFLLLLAYLLLMALVIPLWLGYLMFALGALVGAFLLVADELFFYQFYQEGEVSAEHRQFVELITRSPLFWLSLVPLSIFVITSAGSFFVEGWIIGLMLWLVGEMWQLKKTENLFLERFYAGVKLDRTKPDIRFLTWGAVAYLLIVNLIFIW